MSKEEKEARQRARLLKKIVAGALILTEVKEEGKAGPIYLDHSEVKSWKPIGDGTTLIWGYRLHPICAVKESAQEVAKLKELAKQDSKY